MPIETIEKFRSRGVGMDVTPGCFVCREPRRNESGQSNGYDHNISGFVESKEAGERVVEMFGGPKFARLDWRPQEPTWIQVKIGSCEKHLGNLESLHKLCVDGLITTEKIVEAGGLHKQVRLRNLARLAIDMQNACNMSGVVISFAEVCREIRRIDGDIGTNELNHHPVVQLFASKIHDLCGMGLSDTKAFRHAWEACTDWAAR